MDAVRRLASLARAELATLVGRVDLALGVSEFNRSELVSMGFEPTGVLPLAVDLTRRDLQIASRDIKRPWEIGKAFDASAPCGPLKPVSQIGHPSKGRITLKCNGKVRQDGDLAQMIWNVPEIISKLSEMVALEAGDIIMTGTPAGVGACKPGDQMVCGIDGLGEQRQEVVGG